MLKGVADVKEEYKLGQELDEKLSSHGSQISPREEGGWGELFAKLQCWKSHVDGNKYWEGDE